MENKKVIAVCLIIGFLLGFIAGYGFGVMQIINIVMNKVLSLGNFSDIIKEKIISRCSVNWEGCYGG